MVRGSQVTRGKCLDHSDDRARNFDRCAVGQLPECPRASRRLLDHDDAREPEPRDLFYQEVRRRVIDADVRCQTLAADDSDPDRHFDHGLRDHPAATG